MSHKKVLARRSRLEGIVPQPLARKAGWECKIRHRSRVEKLAARPKVKEGKLLDDDRAWTD